MNSMKAISKQLYGANYERIGKSLFICIVLYFSIHATEINMMIAPFILFLTSSFFSMSIMWQVLNFAQNTDSMIGLFILPFKNKKMTFSIAIAYTGYVLITKTFPILALIFAVHEWNTIQIMVSLFCACNGCLSMAAWYSMLKTKKLIPALLWGMALLLSIFFVRQLWILTLILLISLLFSVMQLLTVDAYVFYRPVSAKSLVKHSGKNGNIFLYLLRYLITNKNYLLNSFGLCIIAVFLPLMLGEFDGLNVMPLGFAILCLNTPICTLLSCDKNLEQAVRTLPGQASRFCSQYCFFIFFVNVIINSIYLITWQIRLGGVYNTEIITAWLFALQSAILSVLLEWIYPIRKWKIESDLFHHPRKYFVPLAMILIAGLISISPIVIWVWLFTALIECLSLLLIARRI